MDIYEYAKNINYNADYYDPHSGYIYKIQEYKRRLDEGIVDAKIRVVDSYSGDTLGYARKEVY